MVEICIINLEQSQDRRELMQQQFNRWDYPFPIQFFKAINGKDNPNFELFQKYNPKKRFARKGSYLSLGELGCFSSHYLLWEKAVKEKKSLIVLEDDAALQDNFADVYHYLNSAENGFDFLWLSQPYNERVYRKHTFVLSVSAQLSIQRCYKGWGNAMAYFITPKAAQKLLLLATEWIYPVDVTMERYWLNGFSNLFVMPFPVKSNPRIQYSNMMGSNSQVLAEHHRILTNQSRKSVFTKLRREYYNAKDRIARFVYDSFH